MKGTNSFTFLYLNAHRAIMGIQMSILNIITKNVAKKRKKNDKNKNTLLHEFDAN